MALTALEQPTEQSSEVSWTSDQLLKGATEVVIVHKGERYLLKKTKNDRLILMK